MKWIYTGFCLLLLWSLASCWMTEYDQHFKIECPAGQTIKSLESHHDNGKEDRVWIMNCAAPPGGGSVSNCEWSGYVNDYDGLLEYQCPSEKIMCGMESVHDDKKEDRKFGFKCCTAPATVAHACEFTSYVNQYDQNLNYHAPDGYIIKGVTSVHSNDKEDRIFKFDICRLDTVGEIPIG